MASQLRIYDIRPGDMDEFARKVAEDIFPVRRAHGFTIDGPWQTDENQYVWIVHHDGDFDEAVEGYVNDPARKDLAWDPMDYITNVDIRMMEDL